MSFSSYINCHLLRNSIYLLTFFEHLVINNPGIASNFNETSHIANQRSDREMFCSINETCSSNISILKLKFGNTS